MEIDIKDELIAPIYPILLITDGPISASKYSMPFASNVVYVPSSGFSNSTAVLEGTLEPSPETYFGIAAAVTKLINDPFGPAVPTKITVVADGELYDSWSGLVSVLEGMNLKKPVDCSGAVSGTFLPSSQLYG